MKTLSFALVLFIAFTLQCSTFQNKPQAVSSNKEGEKSMQKNRDINKEMAISIAKERAIKNNVQIQNYNLIACEQARVWLIIFDNKDAQAKEIGPEYIIAKAGWLISENGIPSGVLKSNKIEKSLQLSKEEAIKIAEKDASQAYKSLEDYQVLACELAGAWRIIFDLKKPLEGGGPNYVIDKNTGEIVYKVYSQ